MVPETIITVKSQGLLLFHKLCIDMHVNKMKLKETVPLSIITWPIQAKEVYSFLASNADILRGLSCVPAPLMSAEMSG